MALDPREKCWWEKGEWPVNRADEIDSAHLEDIRKRIFLIRQPDAGFIDLVRGYGKQIWTGSERQFVPYTRFNWANWDTSKLYRPGKITVLFRGADGVEDLYINMAEMTGATVNKHPPLRADGTLDAHWRLAENPNLYATYAYNADRPEINAGGRWDVRYYEKPGPPNPCNFQEYVYWCRTRAWLPRQVDPSSQLSPIRYGKSGPLHKRYQHVEICKDIIANRLQTEWDMTDNDDSCTRPQRTSEYILSDGVPWKGDCDDPDSECNRSNQCPQDPKLNGSYQAHIIHIVESQGSKYLKKVDAEWIATWTALQPKLLWTLSYNYAVGDIVYKETPDDEILYVAKVAHTSSATNEPGEGENWQEYWATPAYNPEYIRSHPVYVELGRKASTQPETSYSWMWGCNDSAFELCLRDLGKNESVYPTWAADHGLYYKGEVVQYGDSCKRCLVEHESHPDRSPDNAAFWGKVVQYDWWWDTAHPAIPYWLRKKRENENPGDWPLPRGCWRRTWKHSPGRLGDLMWPGEYGDPPGYEPMKFIVSPAVYAQIPVANRKYYACPDVEALHAAAYGDSAERLIAKRHDPVHTRHIRYYDEKAGQSKWAHHPVYELHHDIVNDMRNVLLQLRIVDTSGLEITAGSAAQQDDIAFWNQFSTAKDAYCAGRAGVLADEPTYGEISGYQNYGYGTGVQYELTAPYYSPCSPTYYNMWRQHFYLDVAKAIGSDGPLEIDEPMGISNLLVRVAYKGEPEGYPILTSFTRGCEIGFGDLIIYAEPGAAERIGYTRCFFADGEDYWWYDSSESCWKYTCYFDSHLLTPWPEPNEFLPERDTLLGIATAVDAAGDDMDRWCVLEIDWDKVPESVFEDDPNNFVQIDL